MLNSVCPKLQPSKKYVTKEESQKILKEAQPFIKWLEEADEESDDEEDDKDEEVN